MRAHVDASARGRLALRGLDASRALKVHANRTACTLPVLLVFCVFVYFLLRSLVPTLDCPGVTMKVLRAIRAAARSGLNLAAAWRPLWVPSPSCTLLP